MNEKLYKKQRKECFHNITDNNIVISKGSLNSCKTMLRKWNKIITDTREIIQAPTDYCSNVVERSWGENQQALQSKVT